MGSENFNINFVSKYIEILILGSENIYMGSENICWGLKKFLFMNLGIFEYLKWGLRISNGV